MKHFTIEEPNPLVSIIVPSYNSEKFIAATLDSLVKQQLQDIEIIVVNDGSTDNTENVIKHFFFDRRLRYFKKPNGGTGDALNLGHREARGKFITWCSADNVYLQPFALELAKALIQCEKEGAPVSFVYSDFTYINEQNQRIHDVVHANPQSREDLVNGYDLGMSFMYTRELWLKTGLYKTTICEDFDWVTRAAQFTHFGLVRAILAAFRVHANQISGHRQEEEKAASLACKKQAADLLAAGKYGPLGQNKPAFNPVLVEG